MMDQKQRLEESVRKQVAADERAFNVVLRLIEEPVTEDYLSDAGQMISPLNYSDVTEERAIAKLCGYPICGNTLKAMPKQKYHISTKSNKVFDISERKRFCSNHCYQASDYFAQQISNSPLWTREKTPRIKFTFLTEKIPGRVGEEVFWSPKETVAKEIEKLKTLDELLESKKLHFELDGKDSDEKTEDSSKIDNENERLTSNVEGMESLMLRSTEKQRDTTHSSELEIKPENKHSTILTETQGDKSHTSELEIKHEKSRSTNMAETQGDKSHTSELEIKHEKSRSTNFAETQGDKSHTSELEIKHEKSHSTNMAETQGDKSHTSELEIKHEKSRSTNFAETQGDKSHTSELEIKHEKSHSTNMAETQGDKSHTSELEIKHEKSHSTNMAETQGDKSHTSELEIKHEKSRSTNMAETHGDKGHTSEMDVKHEHEKSRSTNFAETQGDKGHTSELEVKHEHKNSPTNLPEEADTESEVSEKSQQTKTQTTHHTVKEKHSTVKEKKKEGHELLIQPRPFESNSDYILRLMDNKKTMLSKMADIQPAVNEKRNKNKISECSENSSKISHSDSVSISKNPSKNDHVEPKRKKSHHKSKGKRLTPLINVGNVIEEWMSKETLEYLGKHKAIEKELKSSDPEVQQNYLKLLKKAEATEKLLDSDDEDEVPDPLKPLPDFKKIQEETEGFQLKVAEFIKGQPKRKSAEKKDGSESDRNVYLPTVDSQDQLQIRRKIVLDRLSKVVGQLLTPLKLALQDISRELRELVYTFRLDSTNILMKPAEWTLTALVLFRLLCEKLKPVEEAFKQSSFVKFCEVLLESIGHTKLDLDSIVDQLVAKDYDSLHTSLEIKI